MKISCDSLECFIKVCAGLVREGIQFTSCAYNLDIELTGGF